MDGNDETTDDVKWLRPPIATWRHDAQRGSRTDRMFWSRLSFVGQLLLIYIFFVLFLWFARPTLCSLFYWWFLSNQDWDNIARLLASRVVDWLR